MIAEAGRTTTISFDPNCRPNLVRDKDDYVRRMEQLAAQSDIVRLSNADFAYLHGNNDHAGKAKALLEGRTSLFVVTHGGDGVQAWHGRAGMVTVKAPRIDVVDTIGAGDSFQAALLYALHRMGKIGSEALARMTATEAQSAPRFRRLLRSPDMPPASAPTCHLVFTKWTRSPWPVSEGPPTASRCPQSVFCT